MLEYQTPFWNIVLTVMAFISIYLSFSTSWFLSFIYLIRAHLLLLFSHWLNHQEQLYTRHTQASDGNINTYTGNQGKVEEGLMSFDIVLFIFKKSYDQWIVIWLLSLLLWFSVSLYVLYDVLAIELFRQGL